MRWVYEVFYFSKAFDFVNHDIILHKLKLYYAVDGRLLKFLRNYICGRKQCVTVENLKSSEKYVISGVPQGSILGPILFVFFVNDMPQGIDHASNLALNADDTKIWRKISNDKSIDYLYRGSQMNKINFHPKKC